MFADQLGTGAESRSSRLCPTPTRTTSRTVLPLDPLDVRRAPRGNLASDIPFECRASGLLASLVCSKYDGLRAESSYVVACIPHSKMEPDPKFASSCRSSGLIALTTSRPLAIFVYPGSQGRKILRGSTDKHSQLARLDNLSELPVLEHLDPGDALLIHPRLVIGFPGTLLCEPSSASTLVVFLGFTTAPVEPEDEDETGQSFYQYTPVQFKVDREL